MCGTEPFPSDFRAKKYKLDKHWIEKKDFIHIMKNLPVEVSDHDIDEMFAFADKNKDGKLSYKEFRLMIDPPMPPSTPKPHITDIGMNPQVFSPEVTKDAPSNFASPLLPSRVREISYFLRFKNIFFRVLFIHPWCPSPATLLIIVGRRPAQSRLTKVTRQMQELLFKQGLVTITKIWPVTMYYNWNIFWFASLLTSSSTQ